MISESDLKKVAQLARLTLSEEEFAVYPEQFSAILKHFEQIEKVATDGVEPLVTASDIEQSLRADKVEQWESAEVAMANAPERSGNLFKVPPVV